jgi:hypothetical protein
MKKVINIQVLKMRWELQTSKVWQVQNNTVFFLAYQNILTDNLELKIAFQELEWLTLIATFENQREKLIL